MSKRNVTRWILAFDATCGSCRRIAQSVADASDRKLTVLPLNHPDVERWRAELWTTPPLEPTLLRVAGEQDVQGWVGRSMALRMARALGVSSTISVLRALGDLRYEQASETSTSGMSRQRFMRLGAAAVAAGG